MLTDFKPELTVTRLRFCGIIVLELLFIKKRVEIYAKTIASKSGANPAVAEYK